MVQLLELVSLFITLYIPAMIANGTPLVVMRGRKGYPLDLGKNFIDGSRILGDSKTIEGFLSGVTAGTAIGLIVSVIINAGELPIFTLTLTAFMSALGAMIGDIVKSFFKRRVGIQSGEKMPVADQLDFYLGANLLLIITPFTLKPTLPVFVLGLVIVPILHVVTNKMAFKMGLKKVPY